MFEDWPNATDDSAWQGTAVDYAAARAAGISAVWHRCGYGDDRHPQARLYGFGKDTAYDAHRAGSAAAGLPCGGYFFPIPHASTPAASYDAIMRYTGGDRGELPFMVDMEDPPGVHVASILGGAVLTEWLVDLGRRLTAGGMGRPLAYGGGYVGSYGLPADPRLADVYEGQWVANYGTAHDYATPHGPSYRPGFTPAVHPAWGHLQVWQHSGGNGRCPGYPGAVDLDIIDPVALYSWLAPTAPTPPPANPTPFTPHGASDMLVLRQNPTAPDPDTEFLYAVDSGGEWVRIMHGPTDGIDGELYASLERRTLGVDKDDNRWPGWHPPEQGGGRNGPELDAMFERARHIGF